MKVLLETRCGCTQTVDLFKVMGIRKPKLGHLLRMRMAMDFGDFRSLTREFIFRGIKDNSPWFVEIAPPFPKPKRRKRKK